MPLRSGYSKQAIDANIAELRRAGHSRDSAIFVAYAEARKCWFATHPGGHLLYELAWPKTARRRKDYDRDGRPLALESQLQTQRNPRGEPDIRQATGLYKGFTGKAPKVLKKINVPPLPETALAIGKVFGIMYSVDSTKERFHHEFKGKAQPLLVVAADGRQVFLLGGAYTFTKRGFVDSK